MEPDSDVFHVLTIHDGRFPYSLVLCQWKDSLLLRSPSPGSPRGFRERGIRALQRNQSRFVTITSDHDGTAFYLDGQSVSRFSEFVLPADSLLGQLILGDSAGGKHCWTGNLYGLAIYNHALEGTEVAAHHLLWTNGMAASLADQPGLIALYTFGEGTGDRVRDYSSQQHQLTFPSRYLVLHRTFLELPWRAVADHRWNGSDILLNVMGFMPFGFLVFHFLALGPRGSNRRSLVFAVLAGVGISLLIETGQVWLPTRNSSALDLVCNTLGAFAGALLASGIYRFGVELRSDSAGSCAEKADA
jgi:hypothetical protein